MGVLFLKPIYCIRLKNILIIAFALILLCFCVCAASVSEPDGLKLYVLMYHQVSEKPSKYGNYVVSPAELENDIKIILDEGYTPIFASELLNYAENGAPLPEKPIMITFDDGYMSDYVYVLPLLKQYNVKANFALVGALQDLYSSGINRHVDYAQSTWDEVREMEQSGLAEFLSHSYDMHNLKKRRGTLRTSAESHEIYTRIMEDDIEKNRQAFLKQLGHEPCAFVYPFGNCNDETKKIIESHFKMTFGVYEKPNYIKDADDLYNLHRYNMVHNRNLKKILGD